MLDSIYEERGNAQVMPEAEIVSTLSSDNNFDTVFDNELQTTDKSQSSSNLSDLSVCEVLNVDHTYCSVPIPYNSNEEIEMNTSNVANDSIAGSSIGNPGLNCELGINPDAEIINEVEIPQNEDPNQNDEEQTLRTVKLSPLDWKREKNKRLRMEGLPYLGFSKPKGENSRHDTPCDGRKIGVVCTSRKCAQAKNWDCEKFTEEDKKKFFPNSGLK